MTRLSERSPLKTFLSFAQSPWALILCGALASLYEFRFYDVGMYEDDAAYVLGAVAMASGSFLDLALPVPAVMKVYFPGLSALLAPFVRFLSPHWHLLMWVPWTVSIGTSILLSRLARRYLSPLAAWLFLALWVFNPLSLKMAVRVMTEPFILFLVLAALLAIEALESKRKAGFPAVALFSVSLLAGAMRPEGLLLGIICGVVLFCRGRRNEGMGSFFLGILGAFAGFSRAWFFGGAAKAYLPVFLNDISRVGNDYGLFISFVLKFTFSVVTMALPMPLWQPSPVATACLTALTAFFVVRGLQHLGRDGREGRAALPAAFFVPFCFLLVHWLCFTYDARYCYRLIPFVLLFVVAGVESMTSRWMKRVCAAAGCAVLAGCLQAGVLRWMSPRPRDIPPMPLSSMEWMRGHLPEGSVVLSGVRLGTRLHAGFPGYTFFPADGLDEFKAQLSLLGVTHVFLNSRSYHASPLFDRNASKPYEDHRRTARFVSDNPSVFDLIHLDLEDAGQVYSVKVPSRFMDAYAVYERAYAAYLEDKTTEAAGLLDLALGMEAGFSSALNLRGLLFERQDRWWEGRRCFEGAVALDPMNAIFRANLARSLLRTGRQEEAEAQIKEIRQLRGD